MGVQQCAQWLEEELPISGLFNFPLVISTKGQLPISFLVRVYREALFDVLAPIHSGLSLSSLFVPGSDSRFHVLRLAYDSLPRRAGVTNSFYRQENRGPENLGHTATGGEGVPEPRVAPVTVICTHSF